MRHLRTDYDAIQPWPTKRPHHARVRGEVWTEVPTNSGFLDRDEPKIEPLIPEDEPVFLLRAKDRIAPELVRDWAENLDLIGEHDGTDGPEGCTVCQTTRRVRQWADEMEAYAREHYDGGKVPDTPKELLK